MKKQFDPTKPVQTRDGRQAQILRTDLKNNEYPIAALITQPDGEEYVSTHFSNGRWVSDTIENENDLVNVPAKVRVDIFINVYPFGALGFHGIRASADQWGDGRIACLHLNQEITEGEGL